MNKKTGNRIKYRKVDADKLLALLLQSVMIVGSTSSERDEDLKSKIQVKRIRVEGPGGKKTRFLF
jgi:hypothetical protein